MACLGLESDADLKRILRATFKKAEFPMGWEVALGAVSRGGGRTAAQYFFPTAQAKSQATAAAGGQPKRRKSASSWSSSSSSSASASPEPTWKYTLDDMWHVIGIFEEHKGLLVAELERHEDDEESKDFTQFLSTLDGQVAGWHRHVNVGAICAATSAEWKADRQGRVLQTAREFIALGYLSGGSWPHVSRSSFGYTGPAGITSTRTKSGSSTTSTTTGTWASSSFASPPPLPLPRTTHLTWRGVPRRFHPESIASDKEGLRVAMLLELLLSNDTRGQAPGESDVKYETHLLKLIHSEFHGTGVKMPVNMNRGRALFSLSELREFMAIICAGDERAMEVSNGCLTAVAALRSSSLNSASASFPFGSIPPCCTMLRALKAVNSPPQGGAGGRKQHKRSGRGGSG